MFNYLHKYSRPTLFLATLALLVLFVCSSIVNAQATEESLEQDLSEADLEVTISNNEQTTYDPRELGIGVERIPNSSDVVGDFVVGPGKFEAFILPGQSKAMEMVITNRTGYDRRFNLEIEDAAGSADGSDSLILLGDDRGPYSIKDYIGLPALSFDLKQGERARVPVVVSVPDDAESGGFYGSVLVTTTSLESKERNTTGEAYVKSPIVQRIGVLFFITVPGDSLYDGLLQDFSPLSDKGWYASGPIDFVITFENQGNAHLNPYGEIRITNMFGEEVGFKEISPWFVLPQSVRLREISWNREMLYGKYTATLYLNRGYDDIVDERSFTFWVIPWKIILMILAALFVFIFVLRIFFKRFEFKRRDG